MRLLGYLKNVAMAAVMLAVASQASARGLQEQAQFGLVGPLASLHVEGKGTISAVAGACPTLTLTISGIPVTVNASTTFASGQSCAQLAATQRVEVRGDLTITGTTLSVVATMIEIEDGSEREGEGRVTAVTGTCPAITIAVDGLSIQADALTRYIPANRGADCAADAGTDCAADAGTDRAAGRSARAGTHRRPGGARLGHGCGRRDACHDRGVRGPRGGRSAPCDRGPATVGRA